MDNDHPPLTGIPYCTYCEEVTYRFLGGLFGVYDEWYASYEAHEQIPHVPSEARKAFPLYDPLRIIRLHYLCEQCSQANKDLMEL